MPNILDILARAQSLMNETALNSITPPRAGGIMYDTLLVLNQMQLEGASLLISKVYASVSAMEADTTPTSDLTGRALKPGQLVVIVTSDASSSDMGSEYRYNGPGSWTYVGKVGGLPLDTVPTQGSTKGITSGGVYDVKQALEGEVSQLGSKVDVVVDGISYTSPNLFDKTAVTSGKCVRKDTGGLYTDPNYSASDYIPVPADATSFYYSPDNSYGGVLGWAFYNSSKVFTHGGTNRTPAVRAGDAYFRIGVKNTNLDTEMVIIGTSADLPSQYVPYGTISTNALKDGIVTTPKIADGAVATGKIADGAVTLGKMSAAAVSSFAAASQGDKADVDHAFLQPSQSVIKSTNLLDVDACTHGYIDNRNGNFVSLAAGTSPSTYATDFIPVSEDGLICSCFGTYGTVGKGAVYDSDHNFLREQNSGTYTYVAGDAYIRLTISITYTYLQINEGNTLLPYEPYFAPIVTDKIGNENFKLGADQIQGMPSARRSRFDSFRETFTIEHGERKGMSNYVNVTKDFTLDAEILGTIESVEVGFGNDTRYTRKVVITPTSLIIKYGLDEAVAETYSHGLTLGDRTYLHIERTDLKQAKIVLKNDWGEAYTKENQTWLMNTGRPGVKNGNTSSSITATIAYFPSTLGSRIWVFGDSYCSYSSEDRWPYYAGRGIGWLLNAYPGIGGDVAINNLRSMLGTGARPSYLVWCIGMNGGTDSDGSLNTTWKGYTDEMLALCEANGIVPVFQTIPTVPNYAHDALNAWIKSSGYRYIDVADAVEAEGTTTWRGWGTDNALLSSDQVHPTTKGAKVIAEKILADFPELNTEN